MSESFKCEMLDQAFGSPYLVKQLNDTQLYISINPMAEPPIRGICECGGVTLHYQGYNLIDVTHCDKCKSDFSIEMESRIVKQEPIYKKHKYFNRYGSTIRIY